MNLLEPELVRNLVSLIQRAEADNAVRGARLQERRPRDEQGDENDPRQLRPDQMHPLARALLTGATGSE
jgi:hypothetical protein